MLPATPPAKRMLLAVLCLFACFGCQQASNTAASQPTSRAATFPYCLKVPEGLLCVEFLSGGWDGEISPGTYGKHNYRQGYFQATFDNPDSRMVTVSRYGIQRALSEKERARMRSVATGKFTFLVEDRRKGFAAFDTARELRVFGYGDWDKKEIDHVLMSLRIGDQGQPG